MLNPSSELALPLAKQHCLSGSSTEAVTHVESVNFNIDFFIAEETSSSLIDITSMTEITDVDNTSTSTSSTLLSLLLSFSVPSSPILSLSRPGAVTRQLAKELCHKNLLSQTSHLDSLSLLAFLSIANPVEPGEPKTYKKAVSSNNTY